MAFRRKRDDQKPEKHPEQKRSDHARDAGIHAVEDMPMYAKLLYDEDVLDRTEGLASVKSRDKWHGSMPAEPGSFPFEGKELIK